jgi:hypothetical protein
MPPTSSTGPSPCCPPPRRDLCVVPEARREAPRVGTKCKITAGAYALPVGLPVGDWLVDVPGGRVTVTFDGTTSRLRGPAVLVAEGETRAGWP